MICLKSRETTPTIRLLGRLGVKLLTETQSQLIELHLQKVLDCAFSAPGMNELSRLVAEYVLAGGKRVRPQLTAWTYLNSQTARGVSDLPKPVLDAASAWELFHAFLLAHDDIIDNAELRRDLPTLHARLAALDHGSIEIGKNLALVAGDLLFSTSMKLFHDLEADAATYKQALRLYSRIASTPGFGQIIDICQTHADPDSVSADVVLREYHWKTAAYTFEGPMLSGAILAGISEPAQHAIARYALNLGQAYQLQNDVIDLSAPARGGCDLVEGKRTVTLLCARRLLLPEARTAFDGQLAAIDRGGAAAVSIAEELRAVIRSTGAIDHTAALIDGFLNTASEAATDPAIPDRLSVAMQSLLSAMKSQYFAPVSQATV